MNLRHRFCAFLAAGLLLNTAEAQQKRLYLANDDHTDYMWTADEETYAGVFVDMLDYYLALADATDKEPSPYQSRFNADGSFWLQTYEHRKSPAEFQRLMGRIKDGHIGAPMTALVSCYGGQPAEAVLRGMYYAGQLERRYNFRFTLALSMENQTQPLGLASLWAGSGARYSWKGVCACASKLPKSVLQHRPHEIYWYTGQDDERVLMKWYSVAGNVGTYLEAAGPFGAIQYHDANTNFLARYRDPSSGQPYLVGGLFGLGGDSLAQKTGLPADKGISAEPGVKYVPGWPATEHFHDIARKKSTVERQIISSNEQDFFEDFEKTHGATLPKESVTYGNEWDLYSASMVETSARVKRSVEKLRSAEAMAALVSLKRPDFMKGREVARDEAFTDLGLYWEHDWTADGPVSRAARAAWQEKVAGEIEYYVNTLHSDAALRLGALIQKPAGASKRFYAFNPLGSGRTDYADYAYSGSQNVHVVDLSTGLDVPHQIINLKGLRYLRVMAGDVPSVGYKTFEIVSGSGASSTNAAATVDVTSGVFENNRVKLIVDADGAIASFVNKSQPETELAATIGGLKINDFAADLTNGSPLEVENSGPVSVTLKCVSGAGEPHITRITLFRNSERVEISNEITENFGDVRHWAFSFNLDAPDIHTEEVGAVIRVKTKSQGGDYADTHARYDYATLNHFADISDGSNKRGVTLANADCAFAKIGKSSATNLDTVTAQINVLAGGQVDGSSLGIPNQNGATHFLQRFALRAHAGYDQAAAMRFALETQNPLVTGSVIGATNSPYASTQFSLLTITNPDVALWALKPHQDGIDHGLVARVWNQSAKSAETRFSSPGGMESARQVTHIETPLAEMPLKVGELTRAIPAHRMESYALKLKEK